MSEVEEKESTDQTEEEVEEVDQTNTEAEEGEETEEGSEEEEEEKEELIEVNGEMLTKEEVTAGYMRNKDYTQKTQNLSDQQKQVNALIENMNKPQGKQVSTEDQAVLDRLKGLGFVPANEVQRLVNQSLATHNVANERGKLKSQYGFDDAMVNAVYSYSVSANVSMEEAAKKFTTEKKVIKKKGLGAKGGKSTVSGSSTADLTTLEGAKARLVELSKDVAKGLNDKQKKEFDTIRTKMEKGELK